MNELVDLHLLTLHSPFTYGEIPSENSLEISKRLNECLARKDFETIIKDPMLFWFSYCKAFFNHRCGDNREYFSVSIESEEIRYAGSRGVIQSLKDTIEHIRECLVNDWDKKIHVEILQTSYGVDYYFSPVRNISDNSKNFKVFKNWYNLFIQPALSDLAENCGAAYKNDYSETREGTIIQITWKNSLIYPITPKKITEPAPIGTILYPLYQTQEHCDFSITCKDGAVIKSHFALLYGYGGSVLQRLLTSDFKETRERSISFENHSKDVLESFLEFIYMGAVEFSEKMIASKDLDITKLYELFDFAHMYQVEALVDCCSNLISLVATKEDLVEIQYLADMYDNAHLKQLCEYYSPKRQDNLLKV